jgi:hypothetical protein
VTLPIEVLGPAGYTQQVVISIDDPTSVARLWLTCHRCGFRDGIVNTTRGAKASVRVNGGAWTELTDTTADVEQPAKGFGGLHGGFHTLNMAVPVSGLRGGDNTLEFRLNSTDGISSGYRILAFNFRRADGTFVLPTTAFRQEDPATWVPQGSPADVARGKGLWESAPLITSPLSSAPLNSHCASCHVHDGRDLKYFNYSDWSIVARSVFHGLSETDGRAIAAYIRSLSIRFSPSARPWNPPYQPGPGLDSKPVFEWAAGAGVEAVLTSDQKMLGVLFPQGTSPADIAKVADIRATLNMRELPIPLQLPDWNEWLPDTHPVDLWGADFTASDAAQSYIDIRAALSNGGAQQRVTNKTIIRDISHFIRRVWWVGFRSMYGAVPCQFYAQERAKGPTEYLQDKLPSGKTCEDGSAALSKWLAVKNWELFQEFELEEVAPQLLPFGEKRSWLASVQDATERNVFEVAPHRSSDNSYHFKYQTKAQGSYQSAVWYQLQLTLNGGNRDPWTWFPQDWFYTPLFISLAGRDNGPALPTLLTAMQIKMYQNLDMRGPMGTGTDRGPDYNEWWLPFVTPWRFESAVGWEPNNQGYPWKELDTYEAGLRVKVTNALIFEFLTKMKSYPLSSLPRQTNPVDPGGDKFEHVDYVVDTSIPTQALSCFYSCPGEGFAARDMFRAGVRFKALGVDPVLRVEYAEWLKSVFPNPANPWNDLK